MYFRLTYSAADGGRQTEWVRPGQPRGAVMTFRVVDEDGNDRPVLILLLPGDVRRLKPAHLSRRYGTLVAAGTREHARLAAMGDLVGA